MANYVRGRRGEGRDRPDLGSAVLGNRAGTWSYVTGSSGA